MIPETLSSLTSFVSSTNPVRVRLRGRFPTKPESSESPQNTSNSETHNPPLPALEVCESSSLLPLPLWWLPRSDCEHDGGEIAGEPIISLECQSVYKRDLRCLCCVVGGECEAAQLRPVVSTTDALAGRRSTRNPTLIGDTRHAKTRASSDDFLGISRPKNLALCTNTTLTTEQSKLAYRSVDHLTSHQKREQPSRNHALKKHQDNT